MDKPQKGVSLSLGAMQEISALMVYARSDAPDPAQVIREAQRITANESRSNPALAKLIEAAKVSRRLLLTLLQCSRLGPTLKP